MVVWSVATGARVSSSALLFVLFAAPLCVAYVLGLGTKNLTVGEMLQEPPEGPAVTSGAHGDRRPGDAR